MMQAELFSPVLVGQTIKVSAGRAFGGEIIWQLYKVLDWEQPRIDSSGRVLFTAQALGHSGDGISPMMVDLERIRVADVKRRIEEAGHA